MMVSIRVSHLQKNERFILSLMGETIERKKEILLINCFATLVEIFLFVLKKTADIAFYLVQTNTKKLAC